MKLNHWMIYEYEFCVVASFNDQSEFFEVYLKLIKYCASYMCDILFWWLTQWWGFWKFCFLVFGSGFSSFSGVNLIWIGKKGGFHVSVIFGLVWAISKILKLFGIGLGFCLHYIKAEWISGQGRESWVIWGFNSSRFNVCKVKLFRLAADILMTKLLSLF